MKFIVYNDQLFRYLNHPMPLPKDFTETAIISLIDDATQIGRHNVVIAKHYSLPKEEENLLKHIYPDGTVLTDITGKETLPLSYAQFNIIAIPVEHGSKEWALYQMQQGYSVRHNGFPDKFSRLAIIHDDVMMLSGTRKHKVAVRYCTVHMFLETDIPSDGWEIYDPGKGIMENDVSVTITGRIRPALSTHGKVSKNNFRLVSSRGESSVIAYAMCNEDIVNVVKEAIEIMEEQ